MRFHGTLRSRLVLLVLVAILPLFALSIVRAVLSSESAVSRATSNLQSAAALVAANQQQVAETARQVLTAVINSQDIRGGDATQCSAYLAELNRIYGAYTNLGIAGADGLMRCQGVEAKAPAYIGDRSYFRNAVSSRRFSSGEYVFGRMSGRHAINFALPVLDASGNVSAVAYLGLDLEELAASVNDARLPASGRLAIVDRSGTVLAAKPPVLAPGGIGKPLPSPVALQALKTMQTGVSEGVDSSGRERIYAFQPSGQAEDSPFFVVASVARDEVIAPAYRQRNLDFLLLALVTLLGAGIAWIMGGLMIVRPTAEILKSAQRLKDGQLGMPIPMDRLGAGSEFTRIADGMNAMADALAHRDAQLQAALARSEDARRRLVDAQRMGRIGHTELDLRTQRMFWSDEAYELFGLQPGDLDGHPDGFFNIVHPDDRETYCRRRGQAIRHGTAFDIEFRIVTPTGEVRWIHQTGNEQQDAAGRAIRRVGVMQEITSRKLTELALQDTTELLRRTSRIALIGGWEIIVDGLKRIWSDQIFRLYEMDVGPVPSFDESLALYAPEARETIRLALREGIKHGTPWDLELPMITAKGRAFWAHTQGQALMVDGKVSRLVGTLQDITERKHAELALARASDLLRRTGEMAQIGGWELTADSPYPVWSDQIYRIHEVQVGMMPSLAEAVGFYAPHAQMLIKAAVKAGFEHGTPWDLELPMVTAVGRPIWVRSQGQAERHQGAVVRLVGTLQDITEAQQSRAHLRLLEAGVSRLNDIVLITEAEPLDEPGPRIVYVNDAFERRTGYTRAEVLGRSPRLLQGPETQRAELDRIRLAMDHWQPVRSELINYTKSGEAFWVELDIVPVADTQGIYKNWVAVSRDITGRKRAEQAMLESEQRYAALFEYAPLPMWVFDDETWLFTAVNQAAVDNYGYSAEAFLTMRALDIHPMSDHVRMRERLSGSTTLRKGSWNHRRHDGSIFPVEVVSKAIQYGGRPARFVVAMDLTSQRKAEDTVQEHLFTLQRAADASQAITWHRTLDSMTQEVAEQARGVIGAQQAYVTLLPTAEGESSASALSVSQGHEALWTLEGQPDFSELFAPMLKNNRPMRLTADALDREAEKMFHLPPMRGCLAVPLLGRDGKNIGLLQLSDKYEGEFTQQDEYVAMELARLAAVAMENARLLEEVNELNSSLEKKVAQRTEELARQEALFRALAQQAPQVVWTSNPSGEVTYFNRAWFALMGGTLEDWEGTRWFGALHPDDLPEVRANWKRSSATNSPFAGTRRVMARDGSLHTMAYRGSPVFDEHGAVSFWVGIDADITEVKAIEAELRLSNQELEAFSYSVSHDLRSPLNTIDGFSRLLAKQIDGQTSEKAAHYLSRIHAGVGQMGQLIEDILSLAQVSRVQLRHEAIDLASLAENCIEALRVRDPEREVRVVIESPLQAYGDTRLVRVVLENLLGNAWKFSSRQPDAAITVGHTTDPAGQPTFFVRDNGAGFDMAYADKLFRAFQRLHTAAEFPGTGIGLATVNRIIARHGGLLRAESTQGEGATFFFTLPKFPSPI